MEMKKALKIFEYLPKERTLFYYCKDRYAAFLLSQVMDVRRSINVLKNSDFAGLLTKPLIKKLIAESGDGFLHRNQLNQAWDADPEPFVLALDIWGYDKNRTQVSRPGVSSFCSLISATSMRKYLKNFLNRAMGMNLTGAGIRLCNGINGNFFVKPWLGRELI